MDPNRAGKLVALPAAILAVAAGTLAIENSANNQKNPSKSLPVLRHTTSLPQFFEHEPNGEVNPLYPTYEQYLKAKEHGSLIHGQPPRIQRNKSK